MVICYKLSRFRSKLAEGHAKSSISDAMAKELGSGEVRAVYFSMGGKIISEKTEMQLQILWILKETPEMKAKVKNKILS